MSVRQLVDTVDSHELAEWMAYYRIKNEDFENRSKEKPKTPEQVGQELKGALLGFKKTKK